MKLSVRWALIHAGVLAVMRSPPVQGYINQMSRTHQSAIRISAQGVSDKVDALFPMRTIK